MEATLKLMYDREADILHIDTCAPYAAQESQDLGDEIIGRTNPDTGEVENLEILFYSKRLLQDDVLVLPFKLDLQGRGK